MEDTEVITAFVHEGARTAFGPSLHLEGDCLFFDGWWQACFRIGPGAFALRNEAPPRHTDVLKLVSAELSGLGLKPVDTNPALLYAVTYTEIALGLVQWEVWAESQAAAEAAISARAGADAFLSDYAAGAPIKEADYTAELGGARRTAGLPPSVILTVGVDEDSARALQAHMSDCRFETRAFGAIQPDACGALIPTVIVVDATSDTGKEFVMELRAAACGRFLPVAAVTADRQVPLGADIALDPADATAWVDPIRRLLP
ncbi:MAG: hypothetical protein M3203_00040 [Actinomycetota bacterium]|nr:hypothetical protein [Actinomycetota bacterium]